MAPLKISFSLSERDVGHLRRSLASTRKASAELADEQIWKAALALVEQVRGAAAPDYVLERVEVLETLVDMLRDENWSLPGSIQTQVRTALAYFMDPEDLIPDTVPGLGYLDDAIMIELLTRELQREVKAYRSFASYRDARPRSPKQLHDKRKRLRAGIQDWRARTGLLARLRLF